MRYNLHKGCTTSFAIQSHKSNGLFDDEARIASNLSLADTHRHVSFQLRDRVLQERSTTLTDEPWCAIDDDSWLANR